MKSTKGNLVDKYLPSTHMVDLNLYVYLLYKTLLYSEVLMSRLLGSFQPITVFSGVKPLYILGTRTDADSDMKPVSTDSIRLYKMIFGGKS